MCRGRRYRVTQGDGPERLHGEWWREAGAESALPMAVRDYYQVEAGTGGRYWLFRLGDGQNPASGPMRWSCTARSREASTGGDTPPSIGDMRHRAGAVARTDAYSRNSNNPSTVCGQQRAAKLARRETHISNDGE